MNQNILREITIGKETFHPLRYDETMFVMDWKLQPGASVPSHLHEHFDEHFLITSGVVHFKYEGKDIIKKQGEELFVTKGAAHSVSNKSQEEISIRVTYSPCADIHKMFEILDVLDKKNPGSAMNLVKYFYLFPRLGLKSFSTPQPAAIGKILSVAATVLGTVSGWKKLVKEFQ